MEQGVVVDARLGSELSDSDAFVLLRDKARAMFAYNPTSLAGHAVGALVVELVFAEVAPLGLRLGWGASFGLLWVVRAVAAWHISRREPQKIAALGRRLRWWIAGTLVTAAMWGWAAWSFYPFGGALHQIALILVVYTFCVACVPILAPQFGLYLGFVGLVYVPAIVRVALHDSALGVQTAVVMFIAMTMTLLLGRDYRRAFDKVSRLQLDTERLTATLRAEKALADAARQQAEAASRAKTRFFAAASHDLRQPLHALNLLAEALRQRSRDREVAQLVDSINASVDALDALFSELLDITRIDAGGVEVQPVDFAIAGMFQRLRLHFEPTAFEAGLALRFRGAGCRAHGDPLLVERILRNLVSNAIRYTIDGTVLVSCRRRAGSLLLQVWDTGPGIAEAEQQHVFEEFYRGAHGDRAPAPRQGKGLGLGLAIVRRLAALIGAPLSLVSTPGRGTVFTLELPLARAEPQPDLAAPSVYRAGATLGGRLIVVVEDDTAVRSGLELMLRDWGARVLSFDGAAAAVHWARGGGPDTPPPQLLIVDHRLEGARTGTEVIEAMRGRFGAALPAIMVTGSTAAGDDGQAAQHDVHLLLKPVVAHRLRALTAFKLGITG